MGKRLFLIVLLVISMMTAGAVRAESIGETPSLALGQAKSPAALQSLSHRSLLHPDLRPAHRHGGAKGIGLAILPPQLCPLVLLARGTVDAASAPSFSSHSRLPRRSRAPPVRS